MNPRVQNSIIILVAACIIILFMVYIFRNHNKTNKYITVKDKYIHQYFEPKPTQQRQSKSIDKTPKCGLDYLNIVVKYYVVDTYENKYEITSSQYNNVQIGEKFKVRA